jgi:DNA modification methylase
MGVLAERFMAPPFTVLNAREGWWQKRKTAWRDLGIQSELGRSTAGAGEKVNSGMLMRYWCAHPRFYEMKNAKQAELGRELSTAEFLRDHFVPPADSKIASGTSIFDPVLAELAYRWFSPRGGLVLDPFAGGSVRGIVAASLERDYLGIDLRPEQVAANREQAKAICGGVVPRWVNGDGLEVGEICADVQADFLFSCPPYADLEVYSDDPRDLSTMDYAQFRETYFEIIKRSCAVLKEDRFACFVVGEVRDKKGFYRNLVGDTISAFREAGLEYYNEAIMLTAVAGAHMRAGNHFAAGRKLSKTHQNILVFVKGDPKEATRVCGDPALPAFDVISAPASAGLFTEAG